MIFEHRLLASSIAALLLAGCGGTVTSSGDTGGSTTAATGGNGGSGGAGTTTGSTTSTSTTSTSSGGAGGCNGTIQLAIDNGAPQILGSTCNGYPSDLTDTAQGYEFSGGPAGSPHGIRIIGCASAAPDALGVIFDEVGSFDPGSYTTGTTKFTDAKGVAWGVDSDPFNMTLTTVEPTGGVIEGTFSFFVTHGGNAAHSLAGSFHVCHVNDLLAP